MHVNTRAKPRTGRPHTYKHKKNALLKRSKDPDTCLLFLKAPKSSRIPCGEEPRPGGSEVQAGARPEDVGRRLSDNKLSGFCRLQMAAERFLNSVLEETSSHLTQSFTAA